MANKGLQLCRCINVLTCGLLSTWNKQGVTLLNQPYFYSSGGFRNYKHAQGLFYKTFFHVLL